MAKISETYPSAHAQLDARDLINLYDPANRLLTETVQTGNETVTTTYAYDNAHNRTAKTVTHDDGADVTVPGTSRIKITGILKKEEPPISPMNTDAERQGAEGRGRR